MTTMNNEDPAGPSVHEPRELPEPVAWVHDVVAADNEPEQALSFAPDNFPLMGICGFRSVACRPLYTADQMREAIAAERALLLTEIAALREALDEAATDCELHPLYLGDSATLDDIIRAGGDAAFVTGLARGLREARGSAAEKEQPK